MLVLPIKIIIITKINLSCSTEKPQLVAGAGGSEKGSLWGSQGGEWLLFKYNSSLPKFRNHLW